MALIAFDIGGTQIKYGLVERDGTVLSAALYDTPKYAGGEGLVAALIQLAHSLQQQQPVEGIAISSFGLIDAENGVVLGAAEAVPGYTGTAVKAALQAALGLPVSIDNDVNCVALAEGWRGAAQQVRHYIAVAIGTGIGGGIVLNGQIYRGHRAAAGEWGYMWIDGLVWEDHASMRGLVNAVNADLQTQLDGRDIFARYDAGDVAIVPHVERWFGLLGKGLANLIYAFNPQRLVIGGGITARGDAFHRQLQAAVQAALQPDFQLMTELVLASAGNHAGMIGAVRNWLDEHARA
ncbi:ROK family protein [Chitinibacter sp. ZOR0017]|uniref:ROK family protein n=1 Tax=Chitinibacter sp. ZOR0017 TaxID=1339254 RepID=UPI0006476987|nr:ROK family protein [Chitinibacter sp. ZOR0017]